MKLADKYQFDYNGTEYLIDVYKKFYSNVLCEDHYTYYVDIFSSYVKLKPWLSRIFSKEKYEYNCLFEYKTEWVKYANYEGDIDKVIKEAFKKIDKNLEEMKYINQNENEWITITKTQKEKLYEEFYNKVILDLKTKGLIDDNLSIDNKEINHF